jgi:hypothetical protein
LTGYFPKPYANRRSVVSGFQAVAGREKKRGKTLARLQGVSGMRYDEIYIYAFFFDPKGLMAGIGLLGTKITRLEK